MKTLGNKYGLTIDINAIQSGAYGKLTGELFFTFVAIASFMDDKGECYPTQEQLANIMQVHPKTAQRRVKQLLDFKLEDGSPIIVREKELVAGSSFREYSKYRIFPVSGVSLSNVTVGTEMYHKQEPSISPIIISSNSLMDKTVPQENQAITAKDVVYYFGKKYFETYGVKYNPNYAKDCSMVKNKLIRHYDGATIERVIDTVFAEYEDRWKKPKFPRPSIGALVTWLFNDALALIQEAEKKKIEQAKAIEEAQDDYYRSDEYYEKVCKILEG